jgi:competence protein ComEA
MKKFTSVMTALLVSAILVANASVSLADTASSQEVVNINTATAGELAFLPGIGPSKAEAIVKYRKNKPFKKVEQIMRVKGIGRKSFVAMRKHLNIDGATTVKKKIKRTK